MELGIRSTPPDHSLAGRIAWITGCRLGLLVVLLGATATAYLHGELARYPFSLRVVFVTIASGFAFAAALGIGIYALLCGAFHFGWVRPPPDQGWAGYSMGGSELVYSLLVNTLGVTVVALLAGYLAERLRLTGGALQVATR